MKVSVPWVYTSMMALLVTEKDTSAVKVRCTHTQDTQEEGSNTSQFAAVRVSFTLDKGVRVTAIAAVPVFEAVSKPSEASGAIARATCVRRIGVVSRSEKITRLATHVAVIRAGHGGGPLVGAAGRVVFSKGQPESGALLREETAGCVRRCPSADTRRPRP